MLKPLGDRILIRPLKAPDETDSGLLLPENRAEQYVQMQGTVVQVGSPRHPLKEEAEALADKLAAKGDSFEMVDGEQATLFFDAAEMLRDLVRREPCVRPGDDVLFSWNVGQQITVDGETFLLMREDDLLAVLEPVA